MLIGLNYNFTLLHLTYNISKIPFYSTYIVFEIIFSNLGWLLIWNITFLLCLLAFIVSAEFQECVAELEANLKQRNNILDKVSFYKTIDRFREITTVVRKIDAIFSIPFGIILTLSFSTLCGSVFAVGKGDTLAVWYITTSGSSLILVLFLWSLSNLNHKVNIFLFLLLMINYLKY